MKSSPDLRASASASWAENNSLFSSFVLPFLLLLSFNLGGIVKLVNGDYQKTWCVAKPSSDETTLKENINYACSQVNCDILNGGSSCFNPDNLMNHASIAMNLYYQSVGRHYWNCDFQNSGLIVLSDPSYKDCVYEFKD